MVERLRKCTEKILTKIYVKRNPKKIFKKSSFWIRSQKDNSSRFPLINHLDLLQILVHALHLHHLYLYQIIDLKVHNDRLVLKDQKDPRDHKAPLNLNDLQVLVLLISSSQNIVCSCTLLCTTQNHNLAMLDSSALRPDCSAPLRPG